MAFLFSPVVWARLRLSVRLFQRELRHSWVLFFALTLAVAALAAVRMTADRVQGALQAQAAQLLAADALIVSDHPVRPALSQSATQSGLRIAQTATFPSMALAGDNSMLVAIKAVDEAYPLRGTLQITVGSALKTQMHGPRPGTIWVARGVLSRLNLKVGQFLNLGDARFHITAILDKEPDAQLAFVNIAPRVMIHAADLPATALVQAESRVTYRLLVSGAPHQIEDWRAKITQSKALQRGEKLEDIRDARPEVRSILDRASRFLTLVALLTAVLALATAWLTGERFVARHASSWALLQTLGQPLGARFFIYTLQFIWLGLFAAGLGVGLGGLAQQALLGVLAKLIDTPLPAPSLAPMIEAAVFGLGILLASSLPPLFALRRVPAWLVLRKQAPPLPGWKGSALLGLAVLWILAWMQTRDALAPAILLGSVTALALTTALIWRVLLMAIDRLTRKLPLSARLPFANLTRRAGVTTLQGVGLALSWFALLLTGTVGQDILQGWQQQLPRDTPNRFVVNLQPDQLQTFKAMFIARHLLAPQTFPMLRGRLTHINQRAIQPAQYTDEQTRRLAEREFGLSWTATLPGDNRIVEGKAWQGRGGKEWSVESKIAGQLGIKLGSTLTFDLAGSPVTGTVTSIRALKWESFRPNFFVIGSPATLETQGGSNLASFRLPDSQLKLGDELVAQMPNISVIDITAALNQISSLITQLSRAVQFVLVFCLISGGLVLAASLQGSQGERVNEAAILKTLGWRRRRLISSLLAEFAFLGSVAAALGVLGAETAGWAVARWWLEMPYQWHPNLWLLSVIGGGVLVSLLALPLALRTVRVVPAQAVRDAL